MPTLNCGLVAIVQQFQWMVGQHPTDELAPQLVSIGTGIRRSKSYLMVDRTHLEIGSTGLTRESDQIIEMIVKRRVCGAQR